VCGNVNEDCIPDYPVEYARGVAIQFFGPEPAADKKCLNKDGVLVKCTRSCEVLGVGPPIITPYTFLNTLNGVNVTHYGVPSM
jgi:hypothetical protein